MAANGKRQAKIQLDLDAGGLPAQLKEAGNRLKKFATAVPKSIGKAGLGAAKSFAMGFGMQAAGGITDMVSGVVDLERSITRYQIASSSSDADMVKFRDRMAQISTATGVAKSELIKGASAYVAFTGDTKGAAESLALFADVERATGASMEDIAGVAGALRENLKIDPKDFRAGFDVLITQGKLGAVELKNLAVEISNVAPMFTKFAGGSGQEGLAKMGAIMQMMRKDFGSVEETATGFKGIMSQLARKSGDLKKVGIQVFDPKNKNQMRSFLDIVDDIGKKQAAGKLNAASMIDLLGEQKAVNALNAVISRRGELNQMIADAQNSNAVAKDAAKFQESAAGKIDKAWNSIKNKMAEVLTPERINALSDALIKVADLFAKTVNNISDAMAAVARHFGHYDSAKVMEDATAIEKKTSIQDEIASLQASKGISRTEAMKELLAKHEAKAKSLGGGALESVSATDALAGKFGVGYLERDSGKAMARTNTAALAEVGIAQQLRAALQKDEQVTKRGNYLSMLAGSRVYDPMNSTDNFMRPIGPSQPAINLTVKLGDNVIAESLANATVARTKPGGR